LTALVLVGEIIGGLWTGSLALLSDAAHVSMDLFALLISLGALLLARLPADDRRTFGWHRAEVFAALVNGLSLVAVAALIFVEGARRLAAPVPVKGVGLLVIATAGLVANGAAALLLRGHVARDLNLKATFLHVVGDAAASLAVIVGAVIVILTGIEVVDPILAFAIGGLLLWGAARVVRDAVRILFEGVPPGIKPRAVAGALARVPGVRAVHDLHVWALCSHVNNLSAHLVVEAGQETAAREGAARLLRDDFGLTHTTLQLEVDPCSDQVWCEKLDH
jgi:cobalt-zinc-cadmium efflux system protein